VSNSVFASRGIFAIFISSISIFVGLSCQSIAGIEERSLGPCGEYCDTVMAACKGSNAVYTTYEVCMGVCKLLPDGSAIEPDGTNTVACRLAEARSASISEPDVHCVGAGPGGGDACGSNCESYCMLYEKACGSDWYTYGTLEECAKSCSALRDRGAFDAVKDHDGDTLQCRLVHASSSTIEPDPHCGHAVLAPPTAPCVDAKDATPDCNRYCDLVAQACQNDHAQYEDVDQKHRQCLKVCQTLDIGKNSDTKENTIGCRVYHAYNSLLNPAMHCSHAGPTGDGHCGIVADSGNAICDSYCKIVAKACPLPFKEKYPENNCEADCASLSGASRDSHYSVQSAKNNDAQLDCRLMRAIEALTGDDSQCASALGGEACQ
jgi:hypothetical protein